MGNLYLLHDCVRCMFTLCVPSNHGSQFPDIDSFSDFADFVSDMSRKGNQPVAFHISNVRLRSKMVCLPGIMCRLKRCDPWQQEVM